MQDHMQQDAIIKIRNLKTYYPIKDGVFRKTVGYVKAVDDVSFNIYRGEILGIVGESGCGKSTLGKSILQLTKSTAGEVYYSSSDGEVELNGLKKKEMVKYRSKLQIVFQNPYSSLNPSFTIYSTMQEPLKRFGIKKKKIREEKVAQLLEDVNLPVQFMERYPNELSGGQRQRIGIARALSVSPEFIVCDEAVSALDVSIQAQVLQLLKNLKEKRNLTYMFITHNLSVVEYISDRVIIMYLGRIVEVAKTEELFQNPLHPYSQALLNAIPIADVNQRRKRIPLQGDVPSPVNPPNGCAFHPRCPKCLEKCRIEKPQPVTIIKDGHEHTVSCHLIVSEK